MNTTKIIEKILGIPVDHAAQRLSELTPRETEVADLFADGLTGHQIGDKLGISSKTVDIHRGKIKVKLGVKSTVNLVRVVLAKRLADGLAKQARKN
jgi:DNA-binding NarL/FixJ family response regulator